MSASRTMARSGLAVASGLVAVLGLLAFARPALAEPYPDQPPDVSVSDSTVALSGGGTTRFSGEGYASNEDIEIDVTYRSSALRGRTGVTGSGAVAAGPAVAANVPQRMTVVKTIQADADGNFSTTVTLTRTGVAVLTATGLTSGVTQSATVRVVADANSDSSDDSDSSSGLATTSGPDGGRLHWQIAIAIAAIVVGAFVVWQTTRRRRRGTPDRVG